MPRDTEELRQLWRKFECKPAEMVLIDFGPDRIRVAAGTEEAWRALASVLQAHQYHVRLDDTDSYCCREIKGGSGRSLHSFGIALDVNWQTNPFQPGKHGDTRFSEKLTQAERAQDVKHGHADTDMSRAMIADVRKIQTKAGVQVFEWGGGWKKLKDSMHFELDVSPAELAAGIDWSTVKQSNADDDDDNLGVLGEIDVSIQPQASTPSTGLAQTGGHTMSHEELTRIVIAELAKQSAANAPIAQAQKPPQDPLRMVLDVFLGKVTPSGTSSAAPVLSPIDKMFGGEALAGKKTPLAILAYAVLSILQSTDTIGTWSAGPHHSNTGEVLTTLIAGFGGLGLLGKVDRVVQLLGIMAKK